ncbi:MAG: hypothetical protein V8Q42_07085 [Anaerovoracaceae bacterium]
MKTTIKKMLTIMLAAFMVLSLAACGTKTSDNGSGDGRIWTKQSRCIRS